MVAYGSSLRKSRRPGWEDAYLAYETLKSLLGEMDEISKRQEESIDHHDQILLNEEEARASRLEHKFLITLRKEIEKVSLFTLSRQGDIAEAVGALRFASDSTRLKMIPSLSRLPGAALYQMDEDDEEDDAEIDASDSYGEEAALLPTGSITAGPLMTPKPLPKSAARPLFRGDKALADSRNKIDSYTSLGVELLHILRFICLNAMGIRKILKKHDKIMLATRLPPTPDDKHDDRNPSLRLVGGPEDHLQQLANSASVDAISSSLFAALLDYEAMDVGEHSIPLIRFECTVSSIFTLREFAKMVNPPYSAFLSQKAMIVTGYDLGGLERSTQKALSLLLRFQPDSLLTMNDEELTEWKSRKMGKRGKFTREQSLRALALDDEELGDSPWGGVDGVSMFINLMSTLLYTINYYIIAPTANHYAILLGTDGAFGATLVGASSFAAIFAAFLYSFWYTKSSFRSALFFSALCPCLGNLLYALAISYGSMQVAIWGRIMVGFGSAEVVNRQLISSCVSFDAMTKASALFVAAGAIGMSLGPLMAAILELAAGRDTKVDIWLPFMPSGGIIYNHVTSPGFVMAGLWLLEMLALVFLFSEPKRINGAASKARERLASFSSDRDLASSTYGSVVASPRTLQNGTPQNLWSQLVFIKTLIFANMALPVTLLLFGYIELVDEVLISSCSMVCHRYFSWQGSRAGFLIASLGALVLPAHFVVERASHLYKERKIMKYSVLFICASLFAILNYEGLIFDLFGLAAEAVEPASNRVNSTKDVDISIGGTSISSFLNTQKEVPYDWGYGKFVYITFLSAVFMGTIILEGVDTSLMAKVTPAALNDTFINSGLLATLVGTLGRVCGDSMITISALVDKDIFTDFVNATFFPMIPMALIGFFLVWKYYGLLS